MKHPSFFLVYLSIGNTRQTVADFGGYVDPTYNCPAMTTCQQVCVPTVDGCPVSTQCSNGDMLCADGRCEVICEYETSASPCPHKCAPVACAEVIDSYDNCQALYAPQYEYEVMCAEEEAVAETDLWTLKEAGFVFFYLWIIAVTAMVYLWCLYNQKLSPVHGSTQPLVGKRKIIDGFQVDGHVEDAFEDASDAKVDAASVTQTGYKTHWAGSIIYFLTMITLWGFQGLLAYLTVQYYIQQGKFTNLKGLFQDEEQVLKVFIITWMVGFVWTFAFKWPYSVRSLFLRRCPLAEATHVAICTYSSSKDPQNKDATSHETRSMARLRVFKQYLSVGMNTFMVFCFSDPDHGRSIGNKKYEYAIVHHDSSTYFVFMFRRYVWDSETASFTEGVYELGSTISEYNKFAKTNVGLTNEQVEERRRIVGPNVLSMQRPSVWRALYMEFSKPFYTYQAFMIWSWFPLWYYYMAICWSVVILTSALTVGIFQYRNEKSLYKISQITGDVKVTRQGQTETIPQTDLVPGDIVVLEPGLSFADMAVLFTTLTMVDESALTGEATPMVKSPLSSFDGKEVYQPNMAHKQCSLLDGTTILTAKDSLAMVVHTGSHTARGELIRDIYSFQRHQFKFDSEVPIVICILFFYAIFAFAMTVYFIGGESPVYGWFYGIYVVNTILPPLLPTVFTVSVSVSDERLSRKRIACIKAESILVAGKVTKAIFDKTGTLTNQGLDFISVRGSSSWEKEETSGLISPEMAFGMATCHHLTILPSGEFIGNPVDRIMYEASGASTKSAGVAVSVVDRNGTSGEIVKQFDFDFHRMTQSVIVKKSDGALVAFVKGSGENIQRICNSESLPKTFVSDLNSAARHGYYQISMASKDLAADVDLSTIHRDEIEIALNFIGVINFKNVLRSETPDVIEQLARAEVQSVMVTGDSVLTGVCIAKEAGIIHKDAKVLTGSVDKSNAIVWMDEHDVPVSLPSLDSMKDSEAALAISGKVWEILSSKGATSDIMKHIKVYGRCTPNDKVSIVSSFVHSGFITLMCGDGGNDCGALKMAHVGIALSDAAASIVAPFSSLDKTLTSVVDVIREGRCALASALASYKYILMYGQIQCLLQIINAYLLITFTQWCWVFMDGIWTLSLAFSLPLARAAKELAPTHPTASLLGAQTLSSFLGVFLINFLFIVIALSYLWHQDWFQCRKWEGQDVSNVLVIGDNFESGVLFLVGGYQYISSAMAYNFGYEFRKNWFRNYVFVALAVVFTIIHFYITLVPGSVSCFFRINCTNENVVRSVTIEEMPIQNPFNTTVFPMSFRWGLIVIMIWNAVAIACWDYFVVNGIRRHLAAKTLRQAHDESPAVFVSTASSDIEII